MTCGSPIVWAVTRDGRRLSMNADGSKHWTTCTRPEQVRTPAHPPPVTQALDHGARTRCRRVDGLGASAQDVADWVYGLTAIELLKAEETGLAPEVGWWAVELALWRLLEQRCSEHLDAGGSLSGLRLAGWSPGEVRGAWETVVAEHELEGT
jgi:hypothetical protein